MRLENQRFVSGHASLNVRVKAMKKVIPADCPKSVIAPDINKNIAYMVLEDPTIESG